MLVHLLNGMDQRGALISVETVAGVGDVLFCFCHDLSHREALPPLPFWFIVGSLVLLIYWGTVMENRMDIALLGYIGVSNKVMELALHGCCSVRDLIQDAWQNSKLVLGRGVKLSGNGGNFLSESAK